MQTTALPTFLDHVRELQSRLFIVGIAFIITAAFAVPFFDVIVNVLMAPLSPEQKLVYLTPGGAFNFILKVCIYVGIIGTLPVIIFHLYRFLMPVVRRLHLRTALKYTSISVVLAFMGILFAYFISLPAALYFLTNFDLYHIDPMLTIDSYLSFVMTYLVAAAVFFQLPLVMIIIDSIKPSSPRKLMKYQRHIIVGSFAVSAIVTPTPDALNQTILAAPIIVMYQIGVAIVAWRHRRRARHTEVVVPAKQAQSVPMVTPALSPIPLPIPPIVTRVETKARLISDVMPARQQTTATNTRIHQQQTPLRQTLSRSARDSSQYILPRRSIDGIIIPKRA